MRGFRQFLTIMLIAGAFPWSVCKAETGASLATDSNMLAWTVVSMVRFKTLRSQSAGMHQWFAVTDRDSATHMGLYLGLPDSQPSVAAGWGLENSPDIASRVRYGLFLINRF